MKDIYAGKYLRGQIIPQNRLSYNEGGYGLATFFNPHAVSRHEGEGEKNGRIRRIGENIRKSEDGRSR